MAEPSPLLQTLLTALSRARAGATLVLDQKTIGATSAAPLLRVLSDELQITSFTLNDVALPAAVADNTLNISGTGPGITVALSFQDVGGEIAVEALFQAPQPAPLLAAFPALPADFFSAQVTVAPTTATVGVPGLVTPLAIASPSYGVVGLALPSSGLVTTSGAPRVEGKVSRPTGEKGLFVELETETSGYRVAPLSGTWGFDDLAWLMGGLDVLDTVPLIPKQGLVLRTFDLNLYPAAPEFSSLSLDVADTSDPTKPLWSAAGGKVALTDVIVTVDLTYSPGLTLSNAGAIQGNFSLGGLALNAQIPFPLSGVWSLTAFPNAKLTVLDDLASLLPQGPAKFADLLPEGLSALSDFELTYLRLALDGTTFSLTEFSFALGSTESWKLIPGVIELDALNLRMTIDGKPSVTGSVVGGFGLPSGAQITVSLGRSDPQLPWRLNVISPAIPLPGLGDLAKLAPGVDLGAMVRAGGLDELRFVMTDLNLGVTVSPGALNSFGLTLLLANDDDPLKPTLNWALIPNVLTLPEFSFGFQYIQGAQPSTTVFGKFVLNGLEFDIRFAQSADAGAKTDALIAEYSAQGTSGTVDVKSLIETISPFSPSVAADLPEGLEIDIADALLAYLNTDETPKYLFAMDISVEMPLSDLPLIGNMLPADAKAGLKDLKVVVTSAAMSAEDVAFINAMSTAPVLPLPAAGATGPAILKGFSIVAELALGSWSILMTSPSAKEDDTSAVASLAAAPAVTAGTSDATTWIDVQKNFGPVSIQKVGFAYRSGSLFVVANLSFSVGGLELDLLGIGIGSPIKDPTPTFTISGIDVSFAEGPVEVVGGLGGTIDPVINLYGEMMLKVPEYALGAIAGFAVVDDHPSFFLYGMRLDPPLGGPAFAFVTGMAAGLGFNRKLVIPAVDRVATFPFVEWAMGSGTPPSVPDGTADAQVRTVLSTLVDGGIVAPQVGAYWLALGVHFTSFELVDSFALLTASLGANFEIDLLGLSRLSLPPKDPTDKNPPPDPVVLVEIALKASFSPAAGLLAIDGQLTPNSYVLSKDCHLSGGFAFYSWFTGDHEGEFVLTMGGYSPRFTAPSYYPVVPRLTLRWQVDDQLTITGDEYFALTSTAVMAGGGLSAVWDGGPVSAWFTVEVDFLLVYKPFHYYLSASCQLGASFSIDLLFTTVTMTIHLGVDIEIWGPDFAGRATVDLSIISFTISFGSSDPQTYKPLEWHEFVEQLLPKRPDPPTDLADRRAARGVAAAADAPAVKPAVVQIKITDGLLKTLSDTGENTLNYVVDPQLCRFDVSAIIPSKTYAFGPAQPSPGYKAATVDLPLALQPTDAHGNTIPPNTVFGVGPVGIDDSPEAFTSNLSVDIQSTADASFHGVSILKNVPKAFWQKPKFDEDSRTGPQGDPLNDTTVKDVLVGFHLSPFVARPDRPSPIDLQYLEYSIDESHLQCFNWSAPIVPPADTLSSETVVGTIDTDAATGHAPENRKALLEAVRNAGFAVAPTVDIGDLGDPSKTYLVDVPVLALLGEAK